MKYQLFLGAFLTSMLTLPAPAAMAQLIPQPWVSVGARDQEATFSVGARALNFGVELGRGTDNSTGVDGLVFVNLPLVSQISPYVGLGLYSEDQGVAVSGGVQLNPTRRLMLGVGYNSVRGVNGQLGFRF